MFRVVTDGVRRNVEKSARGATWFTADRPVGGLVGVSAGLTLVDVVMEDGFWRCLGVPQVDWVQATVRDWTACRSSVRKYYRPRMAPCVGRKQDRVLVKGERGASGAPPGLGSACRPSPSTSSLDRRMIRWSAFGSSTSPENPAAPCATQGGSGNEMAAEHIRFVPARAGPSL